MVVGEVDPNMSFEEFAGESEAPSEPPKAEAPIEEKKPEPAPQPIPQQAAPQPQAKTTAVAKAKVETDESGALVPKDFEGMYRLAEIYAASKLVPQGLDTPAKVFTALQFAKELGLRGITALRNIYVVNGSPCLWGDLPLAIVRGSPHFVDITEWVFDKDGTTICPENKNLKAEIAGAACTSERKKPDGTIKKVTTWFTIEDAKFAQLWGTRVWKVYPRRMLQCRARAQNLKDNFGDALMGAAIMEYDHNTTVNDKGEIFRESEVSDAQTGAAKLNAMAAQAKEPVILPAEGGQ